MCPRARCRGATKARQAAATGAEKKGGSMPEPLLVATIDGFVLTIERHWNSTVSMSEHTFLLSNSDPTYVSVTAGCIG
jgi:hypothetical protein